MTSAAPCTFTSSRSLTLRCASPAPCTTTVAVRTARSESSASPAPWMVAVSRSAVPLAADLAGALDLELELREVEVAELDVGRARDLDRVELRGRDLHAHVAERVGPDHDPAVAHVDPQHAR